MFLKQIKLELICAIKFWIPIKWANDYFAGKVEYIIICLKAKSNRLKTNINNKKLWTAYNLLAFFEFERAMRLNIHMNSNDKQTSAQIAIYQWLMAQRTLKAI